jgi:hypothetical protein
VYELHRYGHGRNVAGLFDAVAALTVLGHNAWTIYWYYADRKPQILKEKDFGLH